MNLAPLLKQRFFDSNGLPLAGGQLFSYAAGSTTPLTTYSNSAGATNANPVILDSSGYADVWLDPTLTYKLILEDVNGTLLWSVDNVQSTSSGISTWNANFTYQQGAIVQDSSGEGLLYVSLINNNQSQPLTNVSAWRLLGGNVRTLSVNSTLLITDELVQSNSTSGSLTHTLPPCTTTPIGTRIVIKDVGTAGNSTSVKGSGTDLIDGNNTYAYSLTQYESVILQNMGTSWAVIFVIPDGSVTTAKLASGSVTAAKIAASAVTSAAIAANAVTASAIAASAVGTAQIAGGAVTPAKRSTANWTATLPVGYTSVASTTYSTLLTATLTSNGRPFVIHLIPDLATTEAFLRSTGAGGVRFLRQENGVTTDLGTMDTFLNGPVTSYSAFDAGTTAGDSISYLIQIKGDGTNGTEVQNVKLLVYEL